LTIGIVIPLKSKSNSRDWSVTSLSLKATVDSIENQTDDNYLVIITGHDCPDFLRNYSNHKIIFKKAEFRTPDRNDPDFTVQNLINDKRLKIVSGLYELREKKLSFIYQLDSDDLIHKEFISSIKKYSKSDAIILKGGYLYYKKSQKYIETLELDKYCGSTVIAKSGSFDMPDKIDLDQITKIPWTKYRHMNIHKFFENTTHDSIKYLDDKLVAYVLSSGDNFSDRWRDSWFKKVKWSIKPYILGKRVNESFKEIFNLNF